MCARREGHQGDHTFREARGHCPRMICLAAKQRRTPRVAVPRHTVSTYLGLGSSLYHSTPRPRAVTPLSATESMEAWKTSFLKEAS